MATPTFTVPNASALNPPYVRATVAPLGSFYRAFGLRGDDNLNTFTRIAFVGDSTVEGATLANRRDRWQDRFARTLVDRFAPTTAPGMYVPAQYVSNITFAERPATTGSPTFDGTRGFGLRAATFTAAGSVTWTVTGRYAHLYYLAYSGFGTFTYTVDGGAATTVNCSAAENNAASVSLDMGTDGTHTVVAAWASGQVRIQGLRTFTSTAKIHVYDGGHCGAVAADFGNSAAYTHWSALAGLGCDLLVIGIGENDYFNKGTASFQADLTNIVTSARSALGSNVSVLIAVPPKSQATGYGGCTWEQMIPLYQAVATAQNCAYLDMGTRINPGTADTLSLWAADVVHRNKYGHAIEGDALAGFIAPR